MNAGHARFAAALVGAFLTGAAIIALAAGPLTRDACVMMAVIIGGLATLTTVAATLVAREHLKP